MTILIHGEIGAECRSADVLKKIKQAKDGETITLDIASPGGLVSESLAITDALIAYPGRVEAIINPYACSGASLISTAADEVFIYPSSIWMAHRASVLAYGNSDYHRNVGDKLDDIDDSIIPYYMKKSHDDYFKVYAFLEKELFLEGSQIIEAGYADTMLKEDVEIISHHNSKISAESAFSSMAAAYAKLNGNNNIETQKLKLWIQRNQDNALIKELVTDAITNGKTESQIMARLLVAERDGFTSQDVQAAKIAGLSVADYKKYSRMFK